MPNLTGMGVRRGAGAALALVLLLGACSEPGTTTGPDPTPASESGSTTRPSDDPTAPVADPAHAVDPPGKRKDRLWSADILVQWDKALDASTIKKIERLKGVAHTERIGLGQVSLENRVLTVASVDPAAYRLFTRADVADLQEAWDRVAGGEMATDKSIGKRLADEDGMIRLGSDDAAPTLHVGAYTPQIPTIDMVVNTAWADDIEMATDNGLLISTDDITPATIRKPLEKLVGKDASVQILGSVTCHKDLFPQLRQALLEVQQTGLAAEIHPGEYAGCYYPRFIANTTTLSNHSFGLALDLNVPGNQRGTVGEMSRAVVSVLKTWGFAWGGDWRYTDPMHFELAEVKRVG